MRKDTISQALDLLGERHIAYVTDKKQRAVVMTSLREARPAPDPGIFRRILNTAAVLVFTAGVIIGFILMRQSIGPGTTPGDSLTDTETEETTAPDTTETEPDTTDTEPIETETEPIETETQEPDTTDTEPVETLPPETEEAYFEYKIYFIPNVIRDYEYNDNYQLIGYHLTVDVYNDGSTTTRILVYYKDELLFESADCDYAYDIGRIFEEAKKSNVSVVSSQWLEYFDGPVSIRDCVLTDYQDYVQIYPDEFSAINILDIDGIAEVMAEIGGEANYPLTTVMDYFVSPLHDSTKKTLYIICVTKDEETEKKVYVEFAVDRSSMSATEVARYTYGEYREIVPYKETYGFEDNNFTVYEDDGQRLFVDENYDLCRTDKKTEKTTVIREFFSLPEWRTYAEEHELTNEEKAKIPYDHLTEVWVWNERYLIYQVNVHMNANLEGEEYCVIYDLVNNETAISNIGKMYCMTDDRLLVRLKSDNSLGLEPGYYYVDYADNYKKLKFVSVDSFNEISEGCDQQTWDWFNDFVISSNSRYVVMHESKRSWIDNTYADVYVVDLLTDKYSKYYFCSENGRTIDITESNVLLVVNSEGIGGDNISYLDAYIYVLDLDG